MTVHLTPTVLRDRVTIRVTGELDLVQAPRLRDAIDTVVTAGARQVVLDLQDLDFIDSDAIDTIVTCLRLMRPLGCDLGVVASREAIVRPFTSTGTDSVVRLVRDAGELGEVCGLAAARDRRRGGAMAAGAPRSKAS